MASQPFIGIAMQITSQRHKDLRQFPKHEGKRTKRICKECSECPDCIHGQSQRTQKKCPDCMPCDNSHLKHHRKNHCPSCWICLPCHQQAQNKPTIDKCERCQNCKKCKRENEMSPSKGIGQWVTGVEWTHILTAHFKTPSDLRADKHIQGFIRHLETVTRNKVHWAFSLETSPNLHVHLLLQLTGYDIGIKEIKRIWKTCKDSVAQPIFELVRYDPVLATIGENSYQFKDQTHWDIDNRLMLKQDNLLELFNNT
jgi:hypothetical protein